jgi:hypothetical protein
MALPHAVKFVAGAKLARADKAAILGGNAARLLKIKLPASGAQAKPKAAAPKAGGRTSARRTR